MTIEIIVGGFKRYIAILLCRKLCFVSEAWIYVLEGKLDKVLGETGIMIIARVQEPILGAIAVILVAKCAWNTFIS